MDDISTLLSYSDELEPVATAEEIETYEEQVREEQEEEAMLSDRFSGAIDIRNWCSCGNCSMSLATKQEECFCCQDIDRCRETFEAIDEGLACITDHPGFRSVCLDRWVLGAAAIGIRTRKGRRYTKIRERRSEEQFYRSVAYRQFYRLVWEFEKPRRLPLPCCVYNKIRGEFPDDDGVYKGFEEEDNDEEESESETDNEDGEENLQFQDESLTESADVSSDPVS